MIHNLKSKNEDFKKISNKTRFTKQRSTNNIQRSRNETQDPKKDPKPRQALIQTRSKTMIQRSRSKTQDPQKKIQTTNMI